MLISGGKRYGTPDVITPTVPFRAKKSEQLQHSGINPSVGRSRIEWKDRERSSDGNDN